MKWSDGDLRLGVSLLDDPWAPHPVVNRHICHGGGSSSAPNPPDYTQFNASSAGIGNTLSQTGQSLVDWAKQAGVKLSDLADTVSTRAGQMADWATGGAKDMLSNWQQTYGPIYQARAQRAQQIASDMPGLQESWGGKYGADAAQAIDQGKAAQLRKLQGQGLTRPGVAQGAIDLAQSNQRALGTVAAAETGRLKALQYGDQYSKDVLGEGQIFPQVSSNLSQQGTQYGNQQVAAPESAVSTTAGAYSPAISSYNAAAPYYNMWKSGMDTTYNDQMAQFKANQQASSGSFLSTVFPTVLGAAANAGGSYLSGYGYGSGLSAGGGGGSTPSITRTGSTQTYSAQGGPVGGVPMTGRMVPPSMSPSGGMQTDDIPATIDGDPNQKAAINTGEFIIPRRVAEWYGEKFLQNFIAKADKERQEMTVAAPTMGPQAGVNTQPPMMGAPA